MIIMTIAEAQLRCISLMEEFGVYGGSPLFRFKWANGKKTLGSCHYIKGSQEGRYISLSKTYVRLNSDALIEDTIRHEIAHALDVIKRGYSDHSFSWKLLCRITGANPSRLKSGVVSAPAKYTSTCSCDKTYKRHRLTRGSTYRCPRCKDYLFGTGRNNHSNRPLSNGTQSLSGVSYKISTF